MRLKDSTFSSAKPKILVYLFGSLGDTLVAIPALRAVRRHFPNAELILLQNVASEHIVKASQVIPENLIDGYLSYDSLHRRFHKLFSFYHLWRKLRQNKFQAVVYLVLCERPRSSVWRDKLFFRSAGIRRLNGFHSFSKAQLYPLDENGCPAQTRSEAVGKLTRLRKDGIESLPEDLQPPLLPVSAVELENIKNWLAPRREKIGARLISIAPGCKTPANAWSLEKFINIGHRLLAAENCELVVVGGKPEQEAGRRMIAEWGAGINSAGELSVRESGALLSLCDFHFGLDTGTTHLAAVVGTPCFALFHGRDNPGRWFPMGSGHTIIQHPVKCAGCRVLVCPIPNHPCMQEITVESVWKNLREFIRQTEKATDAPTKRIFV